MIWPQKHRFTQNKKNEEAIFPENALCLPCFSSRNIFF
jgi:hypothetical protein